jgi:hypothetical protein
MKAFIKKYNNHILIKAIDDFYDIYSTTILSNDMFVVNFCGKNLEKMEKLLQIYELENYDGYMMFKVEEPVVLSYKLEKETTSETSKEMRLELLKSIKTENTEYIFVPFAVGNIKYLRKNTKKLAINFYSEGKENFIDFVKLGVAVEDVFNLSFFSQFPCIEELAISSDHFYIKKEYFPNLKKIHLTGNQWKSFKNIAPFLSDIDEVIFFKSNIPNLSLINSEKIVFSNYLSDEKGDEFYSFVYSEFPKAKLNFKVNEIIFENSPMPDNIIDFKKEINVFRRKK